MKAKKLLSLLLALAMVFALAACSSNNEPKASEEPEAREEVVVFAAASMTETLNQIKETYEKDHNVTLTFNFDSSGTLKTQIQEGADCDLFISAGQKQMNQLDITADKEVNTEGLDFVASDSRVNLLENKVVLVVPEGNPKGIEGFDDLAAKLADGSVLMAMGNSDVPVGQYTQKILAYYKLDETALANAGTITYGTNVKEVTTQVSEGSVDCGIVYCTDAFSAGLTVVDSATKDMCGQVIYPAAVMKNAKHADAAKAFFAILAGLVLAGILAATMSTADVQLLAAASAIAQNIIRGVFGVELDDKKSMIVARVTVLAVAICGVLFALDPTSSIFRVVSFAWAGFGATFGPIVLFSLYWKRCNKWGAIAGMFSGAAMVFIWKYAIAPIGGAFAIYELLPAFITSCIFIVVVSLLTKAPDAKICEDFDAVASMK